MSLTLGVLHALIWRRDPRQLAYLAFSVAAVAVAAMAIIELLPMRSTQIASFDAPIPLAIVTLTNPLVWLAAAAALAVTGVWLYLMRTVLPQGRLR